MFLRPLSLLFCLVIMAHTAVAADIEITDVWARPNIAPHTSTVVYLTIRNIANKPQELVSIDASDVAGAAKVHQSYVDDKGVSRTVALDKLVLPADSVIEFNPGGVHIALLDLKANIIKPGDKFNIVFKFLDQEPLSVSVVVSPQ